MINHIKTIATGAAGIAGMEATDTLTETLAQAAAVAAGATADTATAVAETLTASATNPIGIIDAILKAIVSFVTVWQLLKPKKAKAN